MAKIKLQPEASSSNVFTIATPAGSADRVITLPDSTGTLATTADNGSQLDHSGSKKIEAVSAGAAVTGNLTTTGNISTGNNGMVFILDSAGQTSGRIVTDSSAANALEIGADPNNQASGSYTAFRVDNTERMRITPDGLTFNGDTAAANALSDYEEGTWTPALSGVTGNFNTSTNQIYTKVGRIVTLRGYIYSASSISNTGAAWRISGLPFAPMEEAIQAVGTYAVNLPSDTAFLVMAAATNSTLKLVASKDNQVSATLTFGDVGGGHIDFSITYMTNA